MDTSYHPHRVVVTGLGAICAAGLNPRDLWESLITGRSGVDHISSFDATKFASKFAAEVKGFNAADYVARKQARHMDRFTQFAVAASLQALESSRLTIGSHNAEDTGVIIGNSVCGLLSICEQHKILSEMGPDRVSPILAPTMSGDAASVQVSILLGTKGVNYSTSSACASGSDAISLGYDLIRQGYARTIIAGGTEAPIAPLIVAAFGAIRALSTRDGNPKEACRPFDLERDGIVLGEGASVIVLEEADYARERGAPILAELVAYGASSDAFHLTQPAPDGEGAARAVRIALKRAGMTPEEIDYIHAHGTATLLNDRVETRVIKTILGEKARQVPVSATKSITGHMLGASGSMGVVISIMAMNQNLAPPTINLTHPDPACDLDYVPGRPRRMEIKTAMVNSFGFGGHNNVLILRQPDSLPHSLSAS